MFEFGSHPRIRIWPRRVGLAIPIHSERAIHFGIKGEADLQGIIGPQGRMFGIEIKTGKGALEKDQKIWKDMIIKFGGAYLECRSIEEALLFKADILR